MAWVDICGWVERGLLFRECDDQRCGEIMPRDLYKTREEIGKKDIK